MNADALQQSLRSLGIDAVVSEHGGAAVLRIAGDGPDLTDRAVRRRVVALAAEHGFRTVALEVGD